MARVNKIPLLNKLLAHRFVKFGIVGASGTIVNLAILYFCQEFIFDQIASPEMRLNLSLGTAIFFATVNNFLWNRIFTWGDRKSALLHRNKITLFLQYAAACWLGIVLQIILTKIFALYFYYLAANVLAIIVASIFNYVVNDAWTFGVGKAKK